MNKKDQQNKVTSNVKITAEQIEQIKDLAAKTNNKYSDTFRMILTIGIERFKTLIHHEHSTNDPE